MQESWQEIGNLHIATQWKSRQRCGENSFIKTRHKSVRLRYWELLTAFLQPPYLTDTLYRQGWVMEESPLSSTVLLEVAGKVLFQNPAYFLNLSWTRKVWCIADFFIDQVTNNLSSSKADRLSPSPPKQSPFSGIHPTPRRTRTVITWCARNRSYLFFHHKVLIPTGICRKQGSALI